MQALQIKEEISNVKVKKQKVSKDKITKSFGELIQEYQREGYSNRESIEKAYRKMYPDAAPKNKKAPKKKMI